jgi:hypothetical protein
VEEQPYDRFYKKPSSEPKEEYTPPARQPQSIQKEDLPDIKPEHEKYIPKGSVFVTMPGQKAAAIPVTPQKKEQPKIEPRKEYYPEPVPEQTIVVSENPAAAQIKYSQPLDEIKEMYVKTLQDRKQKIARKGFWLQSLKKAAIILSLVAVGVVTGLIINSNGKKSNQVAAGQTHLIKSDINSQLAVTEPDLPTVEEQDKPMQHVPVTNAEEVHAQIVADANRIQLPVGKSAITGSQEPKQIQSKAPLEITSVETFSARGAELDARTGERSRTVRNGNAPINSSETPAKRQELSTSKAGSLGDLVVVETNEYKKVAFGGIRDLQLTVKNDSKYLLDNVIVELQYLKPSEQPLKTENITFKSIEPNSTATIKIPDTNRGIKVSYRIINIKSRQMDEGVAGVRD